MSVSPRTAASQREDGRPGPGRSVAMITLGCARNEVDSDYLAGRLHEAGYALVDDAADAEAVLVNTCGFVDAAKRDSIDTLLAASDLSRAGGPRAVVAVGCLAERYGDQLAESLPEADAVLGFDHYPDIAARLDDVLAGSPPAPHVPRDRRRLLPLAPVDRPVRHEPPDLPEGLAPASGPRVSRRRLGSGPSAPLKIASGCDRRCSFCAIPSFRGAFVSRPPEDVLAEARWLVDQGVREVVLVSENSTSYGKDLADVRMLEKLLPALAATPGLFRVRVSYLQPAEMRPSLLDVMAGTPGVAPYFDLSFQHASPGVLRRMRRFGGSEQFCALLAEIRRRAPRAGVRTNVIVGFPGETESDVEELESFLRAARLDAVGVFGYSNEDGTEAAGMDGALPQQVVDERVRRVSDLVEGLTAERAEERVGETVHVLVEHLDATDVDEIPPGWQVVEGAAEHQAPDVDGVTLVHLPPGSLTTGVGDVVTATVTGSEGVDLLASTDREALGLRQTDACREVT